MVDFSENFELAADICDRAEALGFAPAANNRISMIMDIMAADGQNGNPVLRLDKLLHEFDDLNFLHDVAGIYRHIDRADGKIKCCFLPRCAA